MPLKKEFKCAFCDRKFTRKVWYDRHTCDKKKRFMTANSINVQKAYRLFIHWQRRTGLLRRGKEKTMQDFCRSPFYQTFINLVEFAAKQYVVSGFLYIDWLAEKRIPDFKWTDRAQAEAFMADYRKYQIPEEQAKATAENIRAWCRDQGFSVREFFDVVSPSQTMTMVREGRLSPWVLFAYEPAMRMVERLDDHTFFSLDEYLNTQHWMEEIERNASDSDLVVKHMSEALSG